MSQAAPRGGGMPSRPSRMEGGRRIGQLSKRRAHRRRALGQGSWLYPRSRAKHQEAPCPRHSKSLGSRRRYHCQPSPIFHLSRSTHHQMATWSLVRPQAGVTKSSPRHEVSWGCQPHSLLPGGLRYRYEYTRIYTHENMYTIANAYLDI